ncbi:hypothetical protein [Achromobacter dolens]|uniref:hypothetical protein n=1 Tax=Achromobacter dolens TaxID=1287738 RepID=UPI0014661105|nr:hypothetical protein [Achromobacter dolens]CAB3908440.1 hypothetical protein LMG26842_05736 [Achromobacter dolens]
MRRTCWIAAVLLALGFQNAKAESPAMDPEVGLSCRFLGKAAEQAASLRKSGVTEKNAHDGADAIMSEVPNVTATQVEVYHALIRAAYKGKPEDPVEARLRVFRTCIDRAKTTPR